MRRQGKLFRVRMNQRAVVGQFFLVIFFNGFYPGIEGGSASSSSAAKKTLTEASTTSKECPCGIRGSSEDGDGRIVGGEDADVQEYPWQVSKNRREQGLLLFCQTNSDDRLKTHTCKMGTKVGIYILYRFTHFPHKFERLALRSMASSLGAEELSSLRRKS